MIESIRPTASRLKNAAMLAGAVAVVTVAAAFAHPATATAQPVLDLDTYETCIQDVKDSLAKGTIHIWDVHNAYVTCCEYSGGTWNDSTGECAAPPGDSNGSRLFPGNARIPSDLAAAPPLTTTPQEPLQVPSDIATALPVG